MVPNYLLDLSGPMCTIAPIVADTEVTVCEKTMTQTKASRRKNRIQGVRVPGSSCRIVIIKDGQFVQAQAKNPALKASASR